MRDDMILCQQKVAEVLAQVNQIVIGKEECVRKVMAAILAGGNSRGRSYLNRGCAGCR